MSRPHRLAFGEGEPFCHLPQDDLGWLAGRMVQEDYPAGHTVLSPGSPGEHLYFIESGYIGLFPETGDTVLAELVPRECFPSKHWRMARQSASASAPCKFDLLAPEDE